MEKGAGGGTRRRCPSPGKIKHFNETWARIAADEQSALFGAIFKVYRCSCGWWHTFDKTKKRVKENHREPKNARRRRARRGEPPPSEVRRRRQRILKSRRNRINKFLPLRVWEDDGGAFWPSPED